MAPPIAIVIINRLLKEKQYLNIYHHLSGSSHMISSKKNVAVPLETTAQNDYLTISMVSEPGFMWSRFRVNLPSWLDFDFLASDAVTLNHKGGAERAVINIPPGLPNWQLKIYRHKHSRPYGKKGLKEIPSQKIIVSDQNGLWE
ncbi:MAG: hypothetical protein GY940_30080 [bacterium]|nr:hypothetical protein [bacterium]